MKFHKMNSIFMNEAVEGGEGAASIEQPNSVLAGAMNVQAEPEPTNQAESNQPTDYDWIPEKFRVPNSDGEGVNVELSAQKMAASYEGLSKRLGTGDIPPKSADEYNVELPEDAIFKFDEFKAEPENSEFLKQAHELGMTDKQMQFVIGEYAKRLPEIVQAGKEATIETAKEVLEKTWKSEAEFNTNLKNAFAAFNRYAASEDKELIDQIGNNPLVIKLLANIGKDLQEDTPPQAQGIKQEDVKALMASEAYRNPNHPDYSATHAKVTDYYNRNFGNQIVGG